MEDMRATGIPVVGPEYSGRYRAAMTDGGEQARGAEAIAADLSARIADGTYPAGSRLPGRRALQVEYGTADRTIGAAMARLRANGLVYVVAGGGWYVRNRRAVIRSERRLTRSERRAGRGTFETDCAEAGLVPERRPTHVDTGPATADVADELHIAPGDEVVMRERVMAASGEVLQLATSYLPRSITEATVIEQQDTGPGGIYARLEDLGYTLTRFSERVAIGRAGEHEARQLGLTPGDPVYRVVRTAWADDRPVEINHITMAGDRYELTYDVEAE